MIVSIKDKLHDKAVLNILSYSGYMPTEEKMNLMADKYMADASICVFAYVEENDILGVIAAKRLPGEAVVILSIAVDPASRGKGLGAALIAFVGNYFSGCEISAETDDDAVGFYRSCGFTIESLGEKYPGVIRYLCTLRRSDNDGKPAPLPDSAV